MAESAGIENNLPAILASMKTMEANMQRNLEELYASMQKYLEEMATGIQEMREVMEADREEMISNLQEISAATELELAVENIVHCVKFGVPNILVEHTLNESNMEVNQDVTSVGLTENSSCLLYTSRCV